MQSMEDLLARKWNTLTPGEQEDLNRRMLLRGWENVDGHPGTWSKPVEHKYALSELQRRDSCTNRQENPAVTWFEAGAGLGLVAASFGAGIAVVFAVPIGTICGILWLLGVR